jgi:GDP-L-fucose synthase
MDKSAKIYVAGHRGLVGSAIVKNLQEKDIPTSYSEPAKSLILDVTEVEAFS